VTLPVKICGLSTPETLEAAIRAGADLVGFVFHPESPRYVSPDAAAALTRQVSGRVKTVALVVDPDDALLGDLARVVRPDVFQLHGQEKVERVRAVVAAARRPVFKAIGVATSADLGPAVGCAEAGATLLLDAKPPKDAAYPGGHGRPFDWTILAALPPDLPFILSGGLSPETVGEAIRLIRGMGLRLAGVDVSSGVESAPGIKDVAKIAAFVAAVRASG